MEETKRGQNIDDALLGANERLDELQYSTGVGTRTLQAGSETLKANIQALTVGGRAGHHDEGCGPRSY